MGEIRSAIDIALEKTAHIDSDGKSSAQREIKNRGKRAGSAFLDTADGELLQKAMQAANKEEGLLLIEGALSILMAALRLPAQEEDLNKVARIGEALQIIIPQGEMKELFDQLQQILHQFLGEKSQLKQALEQQFMPKLRAKQQELSRRYGQNIPLEPTQDPEFMATLNKNMRMLEGKYDGVLEEVRARIREAGGISE